MGDKPNKPGSGDEPQDPHPGGGQGDKTFTQADVDRIVQERLAQDRKRRSGEGLSDGERDTLLNQIEGLKRQTEALKVERDTAVAAATEHKKTSTTLQRQYQAERINRAIGAAASKANAVDPSAVFKLIGNSNTRVREVTDDGNPTGEHVVEVRVNVERDGTKTTEWVDAETGVASFLKSEAPYLLKSEAPAGAGAPSADRPTSTPSSDTPAQPAKDGAAVHSGIKEVGHLPAGAQPGASTGGISDLMDRGAAALREKLREQ